MWNFTSGQFCKGGSVTLATCEIKGGRKGGGGAIDGEAKAVKTFRDRIASHILVLSMLERLLPCAKP